MKLTEALFGPARPRCIALVGAGGKTTAILRLAEELAAEGRRVVITTTTKMHPPEDRSLLAQSPAEAEALLAAGKIAWAGTYYNEYKMQELPGALPELCEMADCVLVEADGAKKHPLKMIDRRREPVIPAEAEAVVAVAGMSAIGRRAEEVLFRRELTALAPEHILTPADAAALLQSCYGSGPVLLLNQCDDEQRRAAARAVAEKLPGRRCVLSCWGRPLVEIRDEKRLRTLAET